MFMALPHTVTVQKSAAAKDSSGGTVETFTTRQAGVACLVTQQAGRTDRRFDAQPKAQTHTVSTTYTGVRPGDRLLVTAGPANVLNKHLRVLGVSDHHHPGSGIDEFVRLACEQLLE